MARGHGHWEGIGVLEPLRYARLEKVVASTTWDGAAAGGLANGLGKLHAATASDPRLPGCVSRSFATLDAAAATSEARAFLAGLRVRFRVGSVPVERSRCPEALAEFEAWREVQAVGQREAGTALCPLCGIDPVTGTASGLQVADPGFLRAMHERWFETYAPAQPE
jgi:hypothetical protein